MAGSAPVVAVDRGAQCHAPQGHRSSAADSGRVTAVLGEHFAPLFRAARRMGLSEALAEEAAQEALLVFVQRIADVAAGAERAFLFGTLARVAANLRRAAHVRHEVAIDPMLVECVVSDESVFTLVEQKEARELLDHVLSTLAPELRDVFVLYEIEQLTMTEIASALGVKPGTVGSRLHRARREFDATMQRLHNPAAHRRSSHEGA